jgi:hypothetical protein
MADLASSTAALAKSIAKDASESRHMPMPPPQAPRVSLDHHSILDPQPKRNAAGSQEQYLFSRRHHVDKLPYRDVVCVIGDTT